MFSIFEDLRNRFYNKTVNRKETILQRLSRNSEAAARLFNYKLSFKYLTPMKGSIKAPSHK